MYQHFADVTGLLLSKGRPYFRKLVLGRGCPSERSAALEGNSILLAQSNAGEVAASLPPGESTACDNLCVIFKTGSSDVKRAAPLIVCRGQFLACAGLREEQRWTAGVSGQLHATERDRLYEGSLVEQHDEWEAGDRRYFSEASMTELATMNNPNKEVEMMPEITAA